MKKVTGKYTTVALCDNQCLKYSGGPVSGREVYMIGYTDGKRDDKITGYYFLADLKAKATIKQTS